MGVAAFAVLYKTATNVPVCCVIAKLGSNCLFVALFENSSQKPATLVGIFSPTDLFNPDGLKSAAF
jgi:hypothetical protein